MESKTVVIKKIKKRDGRIVDFDADKIANAILKAGAATGEFGEAEAKRLSAIVVSILTKTNNSASPGLRGASKVVPTVEQVQDVVEQVLMAASYYQTAKAYILYRKRHEDLRAARQLIGVEDDLGMGVNALRAMARRYLKRDEFGNVIESPRQAVERVAKTVAAVEKKYKKRWEKRFAQMIASFEFVPAGGYFRGAGRKRGLLANCFVLPVEDDMGEIFDAVKWTALIQQAGGGTGYNFSFLRPKGDVVSGGGFASGPVSFMKAFDAATEIVMLGGRHRGANMGILNADHPDIFEFITCKTQEGEIANFNISVGATDDFMRAVERDQDWKLVNPRTGEVVQRVGARKIFDQAVALAWKTGDPGIIYLDQINKNNPLLEVLGLIEATNVCGEQPLHPFDVCNLGSVNLVKFIKKTTENRSRKKREIEGIIDWERLEEVVRLGVRFLDDGIDASEYPIKQIEKMAKDGRRIGLGVMGWADMLLKLGVRYDSAEAVRLAERVMKFIQKIGWNESVKLAREKGEFPLWKKSSFKKGHPVLGRKATKVRNVAVTTIAPTGTISMLADCSSGIEPIFALAYVKNVVNQEGMTYTNRFFEQMLNEVLGDGDRSQVDAILLEVSKTGSTAHLTGVPKWIKEVFRTAHDISPEWHIRMQAAFQKYTDNAVSKTINFSESATVEDVEKAYVQAWKMGCKGITIYRDKSKTMQILEIKAKEEGKSKIQSKLSVVPLALRASSSSSIGKDQREVCPECGGVMYFAEGCSTCQQCGYSKCEV
jgi:ribonucleoside-diphosphate reductase alpha chain